MVEIWIFRLRVVGYKLGSSAACSTSCRRGFGAASAGMRAAAITIRAVENFMVLSSGKKLKSGMWTERDKRRMW